MVVVCEVVCTLVAVVVVGDFVVVGEAVVVTAAVVLAKELLVEVGALVVVDAAVVVVDAAVVVGDVVVNEPSILMQAHLSFGSDNPNSHQCAYPLAQVQQGSNVSALVGATVVDGEAVDGADVVTTEVGALEVEILVGVEVVVEAVVLVVGAAVVG